MFQTTLENGMRLVIEAQGTVPVVGVYLWINVGSADEPDGLHGAAHFVEHMAFKGTKSYGVGEVAAVIEAMGGDINAWTSHDETVFHATVPAPAAGAAISVLAEMLRSARFDRVELERERLVILEEIRGSDDDPDTVLGEGLWARAFPTHPYGRPVIGTVRSVREMDPDALLGFYRQWYQPSNCCLAIAGPVVAEELLPVIRAALDGGGAAPARRRATPSFGSGRQTLRRRFGSLRAEIAFPGPGQRAPELPVLDLLAACIGGGASAPLEARLKHDEALVTAIGAHYDAQDGCGLLSVGFTAREGVAAAALDHTWEELLRIQRDGVDPLLLERARTQLITDETFEREGVDGRAHTLAWNREILGDAGAWRRRVAAIEAVTVEEVNTLAAQTLLPRRAITVVLARPGDPVLRPVPVPAAARPRAPRRLVRERLPNGVTLVMEPDESEVVALRVVGVGGSLAERGQGGLAAAWARAALRGVDGLDPVTFATEVEGLGARLGALAGRSSQSLQVEVVAGRVVEALDLLAALVRGPDFSAFEVDRVRAELIDNLKQRDDHPEMVLADTVWAAACPGHPYATLPFGDHRSLARLDSAGLHRFHARWARGQNVVVAVTGGFDPDRLRWRLARALGGLMPGWTHPSPDPPRPPPLPRRRTLRLRCEQAHLGVAWAGVAVDSPEQPAVEVLAAVLGGQGGRLFLELRERHGLAYSVHTSSLEGVHPGLLVAGLATDPARLDEAEARLRACTDPSIVSTITEEEVERSKAYLIGASLMDLQATGGRASSIAYAERYGLDGLRYRELPERVRRVTVADVQEAARRRLGELRAVVTVLPSGP